MYDVYYMHSAGLCVVQKWALLDCHEEVPGDFEFTEPFNHTVVFVCSQYLPCLYVSLWMHRLDF